jgi:cytochrome c oxidase subunit 2
VNYKLIDETNSLGIDFTDKSSFDDFTATELHLPKGQPVLLKIRAQDVLHSVYLPFHRVKMDAVPGIVTTLWFTPCITTEEMKKKTGNPNFVYEISCDQICGKGHYSMRGTVIVESQQEYDAWLAKQQSYYAVNNAPAEAAPAKAEQKADTVVKAITMK